MNSKDHFMTVVIVLVYVHIRANGRSQKKTPKQQSGSKNMDGGG